MSRCIPRMPGTSRGGRASLRDRSRLAAWQVRGHHRIVMISRRWSGTMELGLEHLRCQGLCRDGPPCGAPERRSATLAPPVTDRTTWLPPPCRWSCMGAASMQYERAALSEGRGISGPESALTAHGHHEQSAARATLVPALNSEQHERGIHARQGLGRDAGRGQPAGTTAPIGQLNIDNTS